jgi:integrase
MNDTEVRVHTVTCFGRLRQAFLLYGWPSVRLHEDAARHLDELAARCSTNYQRNVAYALSHWLSYCLAMGIDHRLATGDDLIGYKTAMSTAISAQTSEPLSPGTIGQRIIAVVGFYKAGLRRGWYVVSQSAHPHQRTSSIVATVAIESSVFNSLAMPIDASLAKLAPKPNRTSTDIRPLSPEELKSLLYALETQPNKLRANALGEKRNRLIAEWLAYGGLRLSEAISSTGKMGLTVHQIQQLAPDPGHPFDHSVVRILGKGNKWRNVAIPNWLVARTIDYIEQERARAIGHLKKASSKLFVAGANSRSQHRGEPITGRAFQKVFAQASIRAGLYKRVEKTLGPGENRLVIAATHCPHDLRHTYAIATYFAESQLGNSEPWKPIQAQLGHKHLTTTVDTYLSFVSAHDQWRRDLWRMSVRELAGLTDG